MREHTMWNDVRAAARAIDVDDELVVRCRRTIQVRSVADGDVCGLLACTCFSSSMRDGIEFNR
jgi:hypothetical protein